MVVTCASGSLLEVGGLVIDVQEDLYLQAERCDRRKW